MSELSHTQWIQIRDRLAAQFGLFLDDSRQKQGRAMVSHRARILGMNHQAYYTLLLTAGGGRELGALAEHLANHETQFLRNPAHFRALQQELFPSLHRTRPQNQSIRCWSAGCSSGEEAYGIALMAIQAFGWPLSRRTEVWATDLSHAVLEKATRGEYRGRSLVNLDANYKRWFEPLEDGSFRVGTALRSLVQFEQHNLLDPLPSWAKNLDIVFCQNVTIYFQLSTCQQLIERIYNHMAIGGYLLLGFSESLWGIFDGFETVELDGAFVYRKGVTRHQAGRPAPVVPRERGTRPLTTQPKEKELPPAPPEFQWPIRRVNRPPLPSVTPRSSQTTLDEVQRLRAVGKQREALELIGTTIPAARTPALLAATAQLHADLGEVQQAAAEARRALELDVMQETAYLVLGVLEVQNGAFEEGVRLLERALYLKPESPIIVFYLAESSRQLGRYEAAQRHYRNTMHKLAGVDPSSLIDGVAVGWLLATCRRWLDMLEDRQRG